MGGGGRREEEGMGGGELVCEGKRGDAQGLLKYVLLKSCLLNILCSESHVICEVTEENCLRETDKRRGGTTVGKGDGVAKA